jgi:hypothetical protein
MAAVRDVRRRDGRLQAPDGSPSPVQDMAPAFSNVYRHSVRSLPYTARGSYQRNGAAKDPD